MSALVTAAPLVDPSMLVMLDDLERNGALTPTGLVLDHELDYDTYEAFGRFLGRLSSANKWWIGDWLLYGEKVYADDAWAQACHATGRSIGTLRNYLRVALAVAPKRRRADLSWSHHAEVAMLDAVSQRAFLKQAASEDLSVEELRHVIKANTKLGGGEEVTDSTTSGEPTRTTKDEIRDAAAAVWHQAVRDGSHYRVPKDVMARLGSALGYH